MPRKYNSKQTVENIISVSTRLFAEKGYEQTSMQNIVTDLGMSKGAIFHHFKSKEDIFETVIRRQSELIEQAMRRLIDEMQGFSAKDRLVSLLERSVQDEQVCSFQGAFSPQLVCPNIIIANVQNSMSIAAPILAEIMREGVADGSITTDAPEECAEVFILLFSVWCTHIVFQCDIPVSNRRLKYLQQIMKKMGADIISDRLIAKYMHFIQE